MRTMRMVGLRFELLEFAGEQRRGGAAVLRGGIPGTAGELGRPERVAASFEDRFGHRRSLAGGKLWRLGTIWPPNMPSFCRSGTDEAGYTAVMGTNGHIARDESTFTVKAGLAEMLKGGVIMDVVTPEQAKIAEDAGAAAVMALERVPADIRRDGGVARMSDPEMIKGIQEAVTIPVMAKARIGHFAEAQVLEALEVDYIDESEVLTPADDGQPHRQVGVQDAVRVRRHQPR